MKYWLRHITLCIGTALLLCCASHSYAATPKWETLKGERTEVPVVARDTDVTIKTAKGIIIVTANKPVQIKVFTILGQLISNETLPAGTSQLNVGSHGVFIVKTGDLTCKVAL
ncbi:MAG: hypothetical protein K2M03_00945 [Muribaculaceae bacterium]|nr:hypothetical protein [Muribaculaceae bacterium]